MRTEPIDVNAAYVAARQMRIDGCVLQPGQRLPREFGNKSPETIGRLLRTGAVRVARVRTTTTELGAIRTKKSPNSPAGRTPKNGGRVQLEKGILSKIKRMDRKSLVVLCRRQGLPDGGTKKVLRDRLCSRLAT